VRSRQERDLASGRAPEILLSPSPPRIHVAMVLSQKPILDSPRTRSHNRPSVENGVWIPYSPATDRSELGPQLDEVPTADCKPARIHVLDYAQHGAGSKCW
jgi:hypothetical protein